MLHNHLTADVVRAGGKMAPRFYAALTTFISLGSLLTNEEIKPTLEALEQLKASTLRGNKYEALEDDEKADVDMIEAAIKYLKTQVILDEMKGSRGVIE